MREGPQPAVRLPQGRVGSAAAGRAGAGAVGRSLDQAVAARRTVAGAMTLQRWRAQGPGPDRAVTRRWWELGCRLPVGDPGTGLPSRGRGLRASGRRWPGVEEGSRVWGYVSVRRVEALRGAFGAGGHEQELVPGQAALDAGGQSQKLGLRRLVKNSYMKHSRPRATGPDERVPQPPARAPAFEAPQGLKGLMPES